MPLNWWVLCPGALDVLVPLLVSMLMCSTTSPGSTPTLTKQYTQIKGLETNTYPVIMRKQI